MSGRPFRSTWLGYLKASYKRSDSVASHSATFGSLEILIAFEQDQPVSSVLSCSVVPNSLRPMDCRLPGSSFHGIFQARILDWVAVSSSRGSFWPRDWIHVSCGYLISILGNSLSFAFNSQMSKQQVTQVKLPSLVLQNQLNKALFVWLNWFCLLREFSSLVSVWVWFEHDLTNTFLCSHSLEVCLDWVMNFSVWVVHRWCWWFLLHP